MKPSKPRSSGPRRSGGNDRPRRFDNDDRPRTRFDEERAAERRARGEGPRSDGPRSDRPRSDRPRRDESLTARPSRDGSRDNRGGFARDGERSERGPGRGFGDRNRSEGGERSFRDRNERGPGRGGDRNRDGGYGGDRGERSFRPRGPGKDPSIQVWRPEDDDIGNRDPGVGQDRGNRGRGERSDRPRDFADRPRSDRPREERPRGDRPRRDDNDRPRRDFDRPRREFADRDPFDRNSPRPPRFEREEGMESGDQDAAPVKPENAQRRDETRIHGVNACKAFFAVRPQDLIRVYLTQARAPQFADVMKHCVNERLAYHIIPDDELARAADTDHHEGVCFLVRKRTTLTLDEWLATVPAKGSRRVLALENVGNPHNLGAILRTAAHFGVDAVLVNAGAPVHSGAVARTAEGGFEALTLVEYRDLPAAFEKLSEAGFELIATSGEGESGLFDQKLPKRAVIWFGEEHSGLSDYVLEHADLALKIPGSGAVQSLNVSCAVAVVLAEWMRTSSK